MSRKKPITITDIVNRITKINSEDNVNRNTEREEQFNESRTQWKSRITDIIKKLAAKDPDTLDRLQIDNLNLQQDADDEFHYFMNELLKNQSKIKVYRAEKTIFYNTELPLNLANPDRRILIDAELAEAERLVGLLEQHLEYLKTVRDRSTSIQFALKNKIELLNILG